MKPVPVLITWDVDPDAWLSVEKRLHALQTALDLCQQHRIPATFFVTAAQAEIYRERFGAMRAAGHEIGCHGLTHDDEECYDRMPEAQQRAYIQQATEALTALIGAPVQSFRSPRVKTSATTLRLLSEHGYRADSSVCSQRADIISSNLININWLLAPRRPYHPRTDHAFRKGTLPLWEVPVSAWGLPFISSTLRVLGPGAMKVLLRLLYAESRRTGKPIVYLGHPTEFLGRENGSYWRSWREFISLKYLRPSFIRAHGLRVRNLLYRFQGTRLVACTQALFATMAALPGVEFLTVGAYVARLERGELL